MTCHDGMPCWMLVVAPLSEQRLPLSLRYDRYAQGHHISLKATQQTQALLQKRAARSALIRRSGS